MGCTGEFPNGKKIEADLEFVSDLENKWLHYHHTDRAPNTFKVSVMWGIEASSDKFVLMMQDNFGGARLFTSDGWMNRSIRFQNAALLSEPKYQELFTFAAQADNKFRMDWEVSRDGVKWQLGDYIVCTKAQ